MALSRQQDPQPLSLQPYTYLFVKSCYLKLRNKKRKTGGSHLHFLLSVWKALPIMRKAWGSLIMILSQVLFLKPLKAHMCSAHIGESVSDSFRTLIQTVAADRGPYGAVSGEQTPTDRWEEAHISLTLMEKPQQCVWIIDRNRRKEIWKIKYLSSFTQPHVVLNLCEA